MDFINIIVGINTNKTIAIPIMRISLDITGAIFNLLIPKNHNATTRRMKRIINPIP